jgi:transposase
METLCIDSPCRRGQAVPKAYSCDLRERVIEAVAAGASRREAAERFEVSVASAVKWVQRWRDDNSAAAKPRGGSISPLEEFATEILSVIAEHPDLIGTLGSQRTQVVMENLLQTRGRNCDYRSEYGGQRRKRRSGAPMKLNSTQVEQTLSKLNAEVLADDHSAITQLIKMFGDHTFFLDGRGLKILEPGEVPEMGPQSGEVVSLADWSDSTLTSLRPHEPEPSGMTVVFSETKH